MVLQGKCLVTEKAILLEKVLEKASMCEVLNDLMVFTMEAFFFYEESSHSALP